MGQKMKLTVSKTIIVRFLTGLALAGSVTACASVERVASNDLIEPTSKAIETIYNPAYKVHRLTVRVPAELTVSEANRYLPNTDIVWREDPLGNRKKQVQKILTNAIVDGVSKIEEGHSVNMVVRLNTFHALTEKARYTVGGIHRINFDYVLRDVETGQTLEYVQNFDTSLKAYGGSKAVAAVANGQTQKVRITSHISNLMYQKMSGRTID
jgi:hypothetical protein